MQILSVAFSPDGQRLAGGGLENNAYIWEVATGKTIVRLEHADSNTSVAFSPDGKWIGSGSEDRTARVWEAERQEGRSRGSSP